MFEYENKYKNQGVIAGIDEAGRGPLAGPVVCAGVVIPLEKENLIDGINDSKKLSAKKRDILFDQIVEKATDYAVVEIDEDTIDKINILNATKLGMRQALQNLKQKPTVVLIDAVKIDTDIKQENIIKGDAKSYTIACASILAKVYRDRLMLKYAEKYPEYQFEKHKGYGTKIHIEALKKYGKCKIHRNSFIGNFINHD